MQPIDILNSDPFSAFAALASVVSLGLTIAVFYGVRGIRRHFIFKARVPELIERLTDIASKISDHLTAGSIESTSMSETLADAEVVLKSILRKVKRGVRSDARSILKEIAQLEGRPNWFSVVWDRFFSGFSLSPVPDREAQIQKVYIGLYKVANECKEAYEDSRWDNRS